ncbi:hypothetical protein MAM1_0359d10017 [Mucor ambiguus]|uniref:Uncharacterized protein n=1 Tax=Mucor ambiguus TaxID=91626 RepID=A0A0C9MI42_9FUNG|nr:hypothetical protein MAM1_0359d10017 [Mucor ambiguus]
MLTHYLETKEVHVILHAASTPDWELELCLCLVSAHIRERNCIIFEDENESGDAVDSKADANSDTANAVEDKFISSHAEQDTTDDIALPPTAEYSEIRHQTIALI